MKRIINILFLIYCFSFSTLAQPEGYIKKVEGIMMVQEVKDIDSHTAQQLYDRALTWSDETDAGIFEIDKQEEGKFISGNGKIYATHFYGKRYSELRFNFKIEFKINRFRITCTRILISDLEGKTESLESYLYENTGEMITNKKAEKMRVEANRAFSQFLKNFEDHLSGGEEKEFSDW